MKKQFLMMLAMFAAIGAFASEVKFTWSYKSMSDEGIKTMLENNSVNNDLKSKVYFYQFLKKDPSILTNYDKFVSTITHCCEKYNVVNKTDVNIAQLVCQLVDVSDEVASKVYVEMMKKEPNNTGRLYVEKYYISMPKKLKSVANINVLTDSSLGRINDFYDMEYVFNIIKKNQFEYSEENLKKYLKKLNRIVYPNIGTNDKFKNLAVKIQLMIKSLE